jgi:hypothetical protein
MHTYEYQILRYMPDRVSGEFVNLGVVLFSSHLQQITSKFVKRTGRLTDVFPEINSKYLVKVIQSMQNDFEILNNQLSKKLILEPFKSSEEVTSRVLPKDNSSLFFTPPEKTLDLTIDAAIDYLYARLVTVNVTEDEKEIKLDKDVWSKVYKTYFEKKGISNKLQHHTVQTKFAPREFEHAWKNGHWNFFEPVNFNLSRPESIRNKVHKWIGEIDELSSVAEHSHLYILSMLSEQHPEMNDYIKDLKSKSNQKVTVEVVTEDEAERLVKELMEEIEMHTNKKAR